MNNQKILAVGVIGAILLSIAALWVNVQTSHKLDAVSTVASSTAIVANNEGQALTQIADFVQTEFPSQVSNYVSSHVSSTTK